MEEEPGDVYSWETDYERTWEAIREDTEGRLQADTDDGSQKAKRRRLFEHKSNIKLGMMRHLLIMLDSSRSMSDKDLRPERFTCCKVMLENFLDEFMDQNPISQVGLIITRNGRAEKLSDLTGNLRVHKDALKKLTVCSGESSLQNGLELAMKMLRHIPSHASREVLILHGSLTSCDPGDIFTTIQNLSQQSIRCSVIGLSAEVRLCRIICNDTQGVYSIILDESHFRDVIMQHCRPPPTKANAEAALIKMGFPTHNTCGPLALCMCHLDSHSSEHITRTGYYCPQCQSKYCEVPVECKICGLTLVLAPHLARSYHHLFPLPMFTETSLSASIQCSSCSVILTDKAYACPVCCQLFCIDCDLYCHETLYNCPGCESQLHKNS